MGVIPSLEALPGELGFGCGLMKVGALAAGWISAAARGGFHVVQGAPCIFRAFPVFGVRVGGAAWHLARRQRRVSAAWSSRGIAGGRVMMDERRMVALSGVVVASMAERPGTVHATVQL